MEKGKAGLSKSHIRSFLGSSGVEPAVISVYVDGGLATVQREHVTKTCVKCGEPFRTAKWRSGYYDSCPLCRGITGFERGEVTRFSENSRRRLMRKLATLHKDVRPHFVTLTFPDSYEHWKEPEDWKRCLRAFEHRFRRAFPEGSFMWRLEVVDRKSGVHVGEVFPHFHLLVFGVEYNRLRAFVPGAWFGAVGTGDEKHLKAGTQVSSILSRKGIMRYASKTVGRVMSGELAKSLQARAKSGVGRWWGVAIRSNFEQHVSVLEEVVITEEDSVHTLRLFRKISRAFSRSYNTLTVFISGSWLWKRLAEVVVPIPRNALKSYRITGRRIDEPFWKFAYNTGRWKPELEGAL